MKFEVNKHYDLFGYDVVLINDSKSSSPWFRITKKDFSFRIDFAIDQNFLKNMDSTEMRKLERLFRELENYAKFNDIEIQEDDE